MKIQSYPTDIFLILLSAFIFNYKISLDSLKFPIVLIKKALMYNSQTV